jgi:uncharacterized protein YxjI
MQPSDPVKTRLDGIGKLDRFFVQQRFAPIANLYLISAVGPDLKSADEMLASVRQKRMKIREQIDFYADDAHTVPLLALRARKAFEFRGVTDVVLPDGRMIGTLRKNFGTSLLRSSWSVLDAAGVEVATAKESSVVIAILRRVWSAIPFIGDVPFLLPFHFDLHAPDGQQIGHYKRLFALRDRYLLDIFGDPDRRLDRRVAMAFTVALDALQDR